MSFDPFIFVYGASKADLFAEYLISGAPDFVKGPENEVLLLGIEGAATLVKLMLPSPYPPPNPLYPPPPPFHED